MLGIQRQEPSLRDFRLIGITRHCPLPVPDCHLRPFPSPLFLFPSRPAVGIVKRMSPIVRDLDATLNALDAQTAQRVEQLVRAALLLAGDGVAGKAANIWPDGYFERTAGALAGENFERPPQGSAA